MDKSIQKTKSQDLQPFPTEMTQTGNYNTQVANVENYNDSRQSILVLPRPQGNYGADAIDTSIEFNNSCYHLFVMDDESYSGASFVVKKEVALTESTPDDLRILCGSFAQSAIERIKTYPAIFANRNHQYKRTDPSQKAYFGYVIGVEVLEEGIRISYVPLQTFPQQLLNENFEDFGLESAWAINELDNIHWAIKKINAVSTLQRLGLRVLAY